MNKLSLGVLVIATISAVTVLACSEESSSGNTPGSTTQGATKCGDFTCQAGQYCDNFVCSAGCLSNQNCAADQTCEDISDVTSTGTCKNKPVAATKDCAGFCNKAKACNDPDADKCQQACEAVSAECVSCVIDSNCGTGCNAVCGL